MNLHEQIDALEKEIAGEQEIEKELPPENEEIIDENKDNKENEKAEEEKAIERAEEPKTNAEWALARRQMKAVENKLDKLTEAQLAAVNAPQTKQEAAEDPEPNKQDDYEGWLDWKNRQIDKKVSMLDEKLTKFEKEKNEENYIKEQQNTWQQAASELVQYEEAFKKTKTDYDDVTGHAYKELIRSYQNVEPWLTGQEAAGKVAQFVVRLAAQAEANGINPAQAIYDYARDKFGQPTKEKEEPRKDLGKIDNNRKRSVSGIGTGGNGTGGQITLDSLATMTNAELLKLDAATLRQLEQSV